MLINVDDLDNKSKYHCFCADDRNDRLEYFKYFEVATSENSSTSPIDNYSHLLHRFFIMNTHFLLITILALVLTASNAKFVSVAALRESLGDDEFSFSFKKDGISAVNDSGIEAFVIAPPRHRLFGLKDVDVSLVLIIQDSDFVIPFHVHPRGSENYATISGTIEVSTALEVISAFTPRVIVSELPPGHVTSIPQGLPHSVKCISDEPCKYHVFFNTADPGFALAIFED